MDSPEHWTVAVLAYTVVDFALRDVFRQAKVSDLHQAIIFHQDVAGSQVSMDVSLGVQVIHSLVKTDGNDRLKKMHVRQTCDEDNEGKYNIMKS